MNTSLKWNETVKERTIPEESLCKEYKDLLELFMNHKQNIDLENPVTEKLFGLLEQDAMRDILVPGVIGIKIWME